MQFAMGYHTASAGLMNGGNRTVEELAGGRWRIDGGTRKGLVHCPVFLWNVVPAFRTENRVAATEVNVLLIVLRVELYAAVRADLRLHRTHLVVLCELPLVEFAHAELAAHLLVIFLLVLFPGLLLHNLAAAAPEQIFDTVKLVQDDLVLSYLRAAIRARPILLTSCCRQRIVQRLTSGSNFYSKCETCLYIGFYHSPFGCWRP